MSQDKFYTEAISPSDAAELELDTRTEVFFTAKDRPQGKIVPVMVKDREEFVTIPQQVKDGEWVKYPGKGHYNPRYQIRGDLYVQVHIEKKNYGKQLPVAIAAVLVLGIALAAFLPKKEEAGPKETVPSVQASEPKVSDATEPEVIVNEDCNHVWEAPTCKDPQTCMRCGATVGDPQGHIWVAATTESPQTCLVCGVTVGGILEPQDSGVPEEGVVAAGDFHSVYLMSDGTVYSTNSKDLTNEDYRGSLADVRNWTDIVAISADSHTVGLRADGTVVAVGNNAEGQCNVDGWREIIAIAAGNNNTVGLRADGTVVVVGNNEYGQFDVSHWKNIRAIAVSEYTVYGLTEDGRVLSAGQKNYGTGWNNITAISAGPYHLVGLRKDGTVVQTGGCDMWDDNTDNWAGIVAISAGNVHTVGLRADGSVVAVGSSREENQKGQLEIYDWTGIVQISAGMYHTLGLKADGTILAAGSNGHHQLDIAN